MSDDDAVTDRLSEPSEWVTKMIEQEKIIPSGTPSLTLTGLLPPHGAATEDSE